MTIRAYGASERFVTEHVRRLDANTRPLFLGFALTAWLRLHCEGVVASSIIFVTAALAVSSGGGSPAQTGMALQYSIQIIWCLSVFVIQFTSMEAQAVSLERIKGYAQLAPEEPPAVAARPTPPGWPAGGSRHGRRCHLDRK